MACALVSLMNREHRPYFLQMAYCQICMVQFYRGFRLGLPSHFQIGLHGKLGQNQLEFTPAYIPSFFFAGLAWSTWKTYNKMTVERKIPSHPSEVPFYAISFLQKWMELPLLKPKDHIRVEKIIWNWMDNFRPSAIAWTLRSFSCVVIGQFFPVCFCLCLQAGISSWSICTVHYCFLKSRGDSSQKEKHNMQHHELWCLSSEYWNLFDFCHSQASS